MHTCICAHVSKCDYTVFVIYHAAEKPPGKVICVEQYDASPHGTIPPTCTSPSITIPSNETSKDADDFLNEATLPAPRIPDITPISETLSLINSYSYRSLTPSPPRYEQYSDPLLVEVELAELTDRVPAMEDAQQALRVSNVATHRKLFLQCKRRSNSGSPP